MNKTQMLKAVQAKFDAKIDDSHEYITGTTEIKRLLQTSINEVILDIAKDVQKKLNESIRTSK